MATKSTVAAMLLFMSLICPGVAGGEEHPMPVKRDSRTTLADWRMFCWQDKWIAHSLMQATPTLKDGVLTVTNTTGIHDHAKLVFTAQRLSGDFAFTFEVRGLCHPGVMAVDGRDSQFHTFFPNKEGWRKIKIERRDSKLTMTADSKPVVLTNHHASSDMPCMPFVSIMANRSVAIRNVALEIRSYKPTP